MGQTKTIYISALNIKTQPHSPEIYVNLFNDAFSLKKSVPIRSDDYAMLGWKRYLNPDEPFEGIVGEFYKYLELDPARPWLNLEEHKQAEPDEISEIKIPEHMKPNMSSFRFIFFPKGHRLFFETYSDGNRIGATLVKRFFERLFTESSIKQKYGEVDVILEPSREKLDEIFSIYNLKKIEMRVTKPNPDDLSEFEYKVFNRMEMENVDVLDYNMTGKFIKPNDDTKLLARVAASNGFVKGVGTDEEGKRAEEATIDHPLRDKVDYNPDLHNAADVFRSKAAGMLIALADWLRGD